MVFARNRVASLRAGGPRQFSELRGRLLVKVDESDRREVDKELKLKGFNTKNLSNAEYVVAEPQDTINEVINMTLGGVDEARDAIESVSDTDGNVVDADRPVLGATQSVLDAVLDIGGVINASFVNTYADYGPENLRVAIEEATDVSLERASSAERTGKELNEKMGFPEAWEMDRGENAIVCVFDTGFAPDLIDESRIVATYHGDDVDSVYNSPEGHGTMCVGGAAANSDEGPKVPFNGAAPDAGVVLVRTTGSEGQIRGDYIAEAWDWLIDQDFSRPVVSNHSYGTPICSGRPKNKFCDTAQNDLIEVANSDSYYTAVYAAGNEAGYCGRRLSGLTSGITGTNSIAEVITVGALRFDLNDAQRYSSHGKGDCAPTADPKPNVSFPIPTKVYYGGEDGVKVKDMSTGVGGSSGGTSRAAPSITGIVALMQSRSMSVNDEPLQTEEVKQILRRAAQQPRPTQINSLPTPRSPSGWDARFGYGYPDPVKVLELIGEQ